ncbi:MULTISPECIES: MarR family winged helix-turn-helix transcriptional regulator [Butyricimonas]|uniref:MarR family winged helix-turn-helix transcriptional regulator n=1 Tax=Butyricimonas TaxID=574697 RepID=UPI00208A1D46|nr:MarR family transcriptional regulator [Butyricimonas paravirosa]BDF53691.1 hypothetical protein CE91St21_11260 [Odoribacteraceae bacterium]GKH92630.1 hypothetical protein CE91St23_11260 [Odoribacteraceae bacterium]GKI00548.1 hypothetical protein CE91St22_44250 [Odoribacteraceae bacterium]GKI05171.1 hypothetical protein CE91St24_44460 [Odoribacteraceae bacterium]
MTEVSELVALLSKAERGYTKVLNRSFQNAGYDLSREQYELLEVLWEQDHVNQQNISKRLQKDKYNVTKLLNTLQKRGYVQRKMDKEDKRSNFVVLTEKGVESRHALCQIVEQVHTDISFTLSPQELKSAIWVLKKLNLQ